MVAQTTDALPTKSKALIIGFQMVLAWDFASRVENKAAAKEGGFPISRRLKNRLGPLGNAHPSRCSAA